MRNRAWAPLPLLACAALLAAALPAGCGASTPPPAAPAPAAASAEPDEAQDEEAASLDVLCEPPSPVLVDGKKVGDSPITVRRIAPGTHDVTCADEEKGPRTMTVKLGPGESRTVSSNRIPGIIERAANVSKDDKGEKKK